MAKLPDLPLETLLEIIEVSLQSWGHPYDRFLQLNSLSLVCRYFHDITAPIIFRNYKLQLREAPRGLGASDPTCFLTGTSLLTWNEVGVRARLAHLRQNAVFVREIRLIDWGQCLGRVCLGSEPGPEAFDPASIPILLETLDALTDVTSVVFEATKQFLRRTHLPIALWHWLSRVRPKNVSFDGAFAFPSALEPLPSIRSMSIRASADLARVVEATRPALLDIRIEPTEKTNRFNDCFTPYPSLKQLNISFHLYYGSWIPSDYFDFTKYAEDTRFAIKIRVPDTEVYIEAPGAWEETEEHLTRVFVDDFAKLDVHREDGLDTFVISRPIPGQLGGVRDLRLPETDEDKERVLAFEHAVLTAMTEDHLPNGPIDANFWDSLDALFLKVQGQHFEDLDLLSDSQDSDAADDPMDT